MAWRDIEAKWVLRAIALDLLLWVVIAVSVWRVFRWAYG